MRRLALLITGEIRTLAFCEQVVFFASFLNHLKTFFDTVDTYLILKMPRQPCYAFSKGGKENLKHFFAIMRPRRFTLNTTVLNDQSAMIDTAFLQALENENAEFQYDTFFRIRPDSFVQIKELNLDLYTKNYMYTSLKYDQIGNDQVFLANRETMIMFWIPNRDRYFSSSNKHELFRLFVDAQIFRQAFRSWIVRDYGRLDHWNRIFPFPSHSEYTWLPEIEKLKKDTDEGELFKMLKERCESTMETVKE